MAGVELYSEGAGDGAVHLVVDVADVLDEQVVHIDLAVALDIAGVDTEGTALIEGEHHLRAGDGIHWAADQGDVDGDIGDDFGADVGVVPGADGAGMVVIGHEQDVFEGDFRVGDT